MKHEHVHASFHIKHVSSCFILLKLMETRVRIILPSPPRFNSPSSFFRLLSFKCLLTDQIIDIHVSLHQKLNCSHSRMFMYVGCNYAELGLITITSIATTKNGSINLIQSYFSP